LSVSPNGAFVADGAATCKHTVKVNKTPADPKINETAFGENGTDDDDCISPLTQAIAALNSSSAALDNLFTSSGKTLTVNSHDDLAEAMRKLELTTASLVEVDAGPNQNGPVDTTVSVSRRASFQSSAARSKPPPPVRRTSSVVGSKASGGNHSARVMGDSHVTHHRKAFSFVLPEHGESEHYSMESTSTPIAPLPSTVTVSTRTCPRRTLSSTHADVIQSLNQQLADKVPSPSVCRPYRRSTSVAATGGRVLVVSGTSDSLSNVPRQLSDSQLSAGTFLAEIHRGVTLRPAVTNDRSAPKLHHV
jgi:hypothetical protein